MKNAFLSLGFILLTTLVQAGENITALKEGDAMNSVAQAAFSVTQVSPKLKTANNTKYRVTVVDYGPGSMAPSSLIVYVSGADGEIGGEAGFESAYYVDAKIVDVKSFSTSKNDVVLKVRIVNDQGQLATKTLKLQYNPASQSLITQ